MGIFLRHSWNVKPPRWGSPADVQYAIKINSEKIYNVDPDSIVLAMPLFWGLPLLDYSGKNNHGVNHGATYKDGSLKFDGVNDYVDVGNETSIKFGSADSYSVGLRFKTSAPAPSSEAVMFSKYKSAGAKIPFYLAVLPTTDYPRFSIYDGSFNPGVVGTNAVNDGIWHDIYGVRNVTDDKLYLYIDGELVGSEIDTTTTTIDDNTRAWIGGLGDNTQTSLQADTEFDGHIAKVRINNVALTAEQIALFYDLPYGLYQPVSRPLYFFSKVTSLAVTLPIITADISGEQASSLNVTLPMITAEILGGVGGFLDATLPMITAEIEGRESQSGDLTVTLPCITAEILGGVGGFLDATLPMITAGMRGGALLEATLPCITAGIEGKTGIVGTIDATLPMIVADILGKVETLGDINAILPVIRSHITGKTGKVGSIDVTLPMIEAALTGYQEVTGDINATLPMITARIVGTPDRFATCTPLRFTEPI